MNQDKQAIWMLQTKRADFDGLAKRFNISPITARIIRNRDITGDIRRGILHTDLLVLPEFGLCGTGYPCDVVGFSRRICSRCFLPSIRYRCIRLSLCRRAVRRRCGLGGISAASAGSQ